MSDEEFRAAKETETKFQFYFVALAFTILALAIQTSPADAPVASRVFELVAWILLLLAGLLGLWYLELVPSRRMRYAELNDMRKELRARDYFRGQRSDDWHMVHTDEIRRDSNNLQNILVKSDRVERRKYRWARVCLVAGLIAAGVARGYPLVQEIVGLEKPAGSMLILKAVD